VFAGVRRYVYFEIFGVTIDKLPDFMRFSRLTLDVRRPSWSDQQEIDMARDGLRQHQAMARGDKIAGGGDFGVEPLSRVTGGIPHPDRDAATTGKMLADSERAGPPRINRGPGQMGATAHSDHGPHHASPEQSKPMRGREPHHVGGSNSRGSRLPR
jgi:hypothetical protein